MPVVSAFPPSFTLFEREAREGAHDQSFFVSIFDHCLTEEEAAGCELFTFGQARSAGQLVEYLEGERRFLGLYLRLAADGVSRVRAPGVLQPLRPGGRRLQEVLVSSLRERRFMDLYFHGPGVRVLGGWDRTDFWACSRNAAIGNLTDAVTRAGLHVI